MSGGLQPVDNDITRCTYCPQPAAGPCATCQKPVCGDCSVLTESGVKVWAICIRCERRDGRSLRTAWGGFLLWLVGILVVLGLVVAALSWFEARVR
jgi:hypothetical protein